MGVQSQRRAHVHEGERTRELAPIKILGQPAKLRRLDSTDDDEELSRHFARRVMARARNRVGVVSADDENGAADKTTEAHEYDKKAVVNAATSEEKRVQHQKELLRIKKAERRAQAKHRKRTKETEPVCEVVATVQEHELSNPPVDCITTKDQGEAPTHPIIDDYVSVDEDADSRDSDGTLKKKKGQNKTFYDDAEGQPDIGTARSITDTLPRCADLTIKDQGQTQPDFIESPPELPVQNQLLDDKTEQAIGIFDQIVEASLEDVSQGERADSIDHEAESLDPSLQQPSSASIVSDTKTVSVDDVERDSRHIRQIEGTDIVDDNETELWPKRVKQSGSTRHGPSDDEAATTIQKVMKRGILKKTKRTLSKATSFIRHSSKVLAEDTLISAVVSEQQTRPTFVPLLTLRPRSPSLSSQSRRSADGVQTDRSESSLSDRRSRSSASSSSLASSLSDSYESDSNKNRWRHRRLKNERDIGPSVDMLPVSKQRRQKYGDVHHYMATRIQARARGINGRYLARLRAIEFDREIRDQAMRELEQEASVRIQAQVKGYFQRKRFQVDDVDDEDEEEDEPHDNGSSKVRRARTERHRPRRRRRIKKHGTVVPHGPQTQRENPVEGDSDMPKVASWPEEFNLEPLDGWDELNSVANTQGETVTTAHFLSKGKLRIFCGTWNLHAKKPKDDLRLWIALNRYHIVAVGTEECVHSIAKSVVFTSKKQWEDQLKETLGNEYVLVAAHSLTAIHNVVFVHESVVPYLQNVQSDAVATGLGNQLGNKGGVGIAFSIGNTSFAFVNSHFDAHQHNVSKRNANFHRINQELHLFPLKSPPTAQSPLPQALGKSTTSRFSTSSSPKPAVGGHAAATALGASSSPSSASSFRRKLAISEAFDRVFWYGDLNYRINGTRRMIDLLLLHNQHDVLRFNDQLQIEMQKGNVFHHFHEGPLHFRPTYKFDKHSNVYDSGPKQRIPSWTDRILYLSNEKPQDVELLSYRSHMSFQTSDHRPVGAVFQVRFGGANVGEAKVSTPGEDKDAFARVIARGYKSNQTRSEVCAVQ